MSAGFAKPGFISFLKNSLADRPSLWGRGKSALRSLTQGNRHGLADLEHGVDHLVAGDAALDAGHSQFGGAKRIGGASRVSFDAWNLDQSGDRIAAQPQHVFQGDGQCLC